MSGNTPEFTLDSIRLNSDLDRRALALGYANTGRVQVRDLFEPETADRLYQCLLMETPWGMAYNNGADTVFEPASKWKERAPQAASEILRGIEQRAGSQFQYLYHCYPMLTAYTSGWDPDLLLHRFLEYLNTEEMLDFVRQVTGLPALIKADAQATWYGHEHFLTLHDDANAAEGRRVAYVINMTRDWREADGGYLLFLDKSGDVEMGFRPRFNTLNLFSVPQRHLVSYVPRYAQGRRFAITGWFRDR
jgi:Rps23 Pro-64 3,4-dihydroxylase Tpa1-like proline 4-hydroxylase